MQQDVLFLIAQRHLGDLRRIDHGVKALRLLAQRGKACRCGMRGSCFQLLHCFKHPARYLLEQRLGLHLAQGTEVLAGDEPFSVEWTAQHGLRQ